MIIVRLLYDSSQLSRGLRDPWSHGNLADPDGNLTLCVTKWVSQPKNEKTGSFRKQHVVEAWQWQNLNSSQSFSQGAERPPQGVLICPARNKESTEK